MSFGNLTYLILIMVVSYQLKADEVNVDVKEEIREEQVEQNGEKQSSSWRGFLDDDKGNSVVFGAKTSIKNPLELRDPFKAPVLNPNHKKEKEREEGLFSNVNDPDDVSLSNIKILGVVVGRDRRAFASSGDKGSTFILKEGMTIQKGMVELKAIIPGGVIFVEKITNIYGQVEYLETIVPISK